MNMIPHIICSPPPPPPAHATTLMPTFPLSHYSSASPSSSELIGTPEDSGGIAEERERERERREQRDTSTDPIDDRLVGLVVVVFVLATLIWDVIQ